MPPEQIVIHRKGFYQLLKIMGVGLLALVLTGYAVWAYAQERHDLPPFDQEKAKKLSPEKRAEYDRLLFNELPDWNAGSRRHNLFPREAEWEKMAADGHELSYLTLTVISPTAGKFSPDKALTRLDEMAKENNTGAMCFYGWLLPNAKDRRYKKAVQYIEHGAALGPPECKRELGNLIIGNAAPIRRAGLKVNTNKGYELLVESAKEGYSSPRSLWLFFDDKGFAKAADIERAYCWASVYEQYQSKMPERLTSKSYLLDRAEDHPEKHNKNDLLLLANKLRSTKFTLETCIDFGLE